MSDFAGGNKSGLILFVHTYQNFTTGIRKSRTWRSATKGMWKMKLSLFSLFLLLQ